jgi:hypothetical protein
MEMVTLEIVGSGAIVMRTILECLVTEPRISRQMALVD